MNKKDIKDFTLEELEKEVIKIGEPKYRAEQIFFWIYRKGIRSFDRINNISKQFQRKLNESYFISILGLTAQAKSADGSTVKFLFKLSDGNYIESVLIGAKARKTLCLSTQVGCKFTCSFCASGIMGFARNLTVPEIINQILFVQNRLKVKITNYVFMGMGEPLDNYANTSKAIIIMNTPEGLGVGARRITISTCGIIPSIKKLENLGLQVNLSVSLHAGNDKLRNMLMAVNKRYPINSLVKTCKEYMDKTGRLITLEYVLIKDVNNAPQNADELAVIANKLTAKVNLIPYSMIEQVDLRSPNRQDMDAFVKRLAAKGVNVTVRESKGADIRAACGQLAGRKKDEPR